MRVDPETRLIQHLDYFGTTVIELGISRRHERLWIDISARVRRPPGLTCRGRRTGARSRTAPTTPRRASSCCSTAPSPTTWRSTIWSARPAPTRRWAPRSGCWTSIPDRFEYRAGVTYVGSTVGDLLAAGAGVCQDFAHLALLLLRRHGIGSRYVSGYLWAPSQRRRGPRPRSRPTPGWRRCFPSHDGLHLDRDWIQPTASSVARPTSRSATAATTPTCRRSRASTAAWRARS